MKKTLVLIALTALPLAGSSQQFLPELVRFVNSCSTTQWVYGYYFGGGLAGGSFPSIPLPPNTSNTFVLPPNPGIGPVTVVGWLHSARLNEGNSFVIYDPDQPPNPLDVCQFGNPPAIDDASDFPPPKMQPPCGMPVWSVSLPAVSTWIQDEPLGYDTQLAPGVQLEGPSTAVGTPHYLATQAQRATGGGTYAAEREIAASSLRAAGYSEAQIQQALSEADNYFQSIGVSSTTPTRIPGNRRP